MRYALRNMVVLVALLLCTPAAALRGAETRLESTAVQQQEPGRQADAASNDSRSFHIVSDRMWRARGRADAKIIVSAPTPSSVDQTVKMLSERHKTHKAAAYLCAGDHIAAIKVLLPLVDEFVVVPFHGASDEKPAVDELTWPGYDHPLINRLRQVRRLTQGKRLNAALLASFVSPARVWGVGAERNTKFEEVQWMMFAVVGADWDGIVWYDFDVTRGQFAQFAPRVTQIADALEQHGSDLGSASPMRWVQSSQGQPVSALCSGRTLFVVLLNPEYFALNAEGTGVCSPEEPTERKGELLIKIPAGRAVTSGAFLLGQPVDITHDKDIVRVKYSFTGGGDLIVLNLSDEAKAGRDQQ